MPIDQNKRLLNCVDECQFDDTAINEMRRKYHCVEEEKSNIFNPLMPQHLRNECKGIFGSSIINEFNLNHSEIKYGQPEEE